jgi:predicted secreted protein
VPFNLIKIQLLLGTLLLLGQAGPAAAGTMTQVGMEHNGKEVAVKVGGVIEVRLMASGGTGYSWYLDDLDSRHLEFISEKTEHPTADAMVGQPIAHTWRFKARRTGRTQIKLDYYRKWEGVGSAAQHFLLKVSIVPEGR